MRITARIISLLATAIVGLTLTSCGGGGGGGGGNGGGGNNNAGSGESNDTTGLAPKSLATQQWILYSSHSNTNYEFTFSSSNKVIIEAFNHNSPLKNDTRIATYTYSKTGPNTATLTITGTFATAEYSNSMGWYWDLSSSTRTYKLTFSTQFKASSSYGNLTYLQG